MALNNKGECVDEIFLVENSWESLAEMLQRRDFEGFKSGLEKTAVDVNYHYAKNNEMTFLHLALLIGNLDIVRFLVDKGANVNAVMSDGITVLGAAMVAGSLETIAYLLDKGADVNAQTGDHITPLMLFINIIETVPYSLENILKVLDMILAKGALVATKDAKGNTVLHHLAENPELKSAVPLQQQEALRKRYEVILARLLKAGAAIDETNNAKVTPLHAALKKEHYFLAELLITHGADVNKPYAAVGTTPLQYAVSQNVLPLVLVLLEYGAIIDDTTRALANASSHKEIAKLLKNT